MKMNKYIKKENPIRQISVDKISKHENEKLFKNDENERIQKMLTEEANIKLKNLSKKNK
jgi:hypothetical protein